MQVDTVLLNVLQRLKWMNHKCTVMKRDVKEEARYKHEKKFVFDV